MTVTEGFHSIRCVGFVEWNWGGMMGIDAGPAEKGDVVGTDAKTRVGVEHLCFAQKMTVYLKPRRLSLEGFGRVSSRLNAP
jgi:hypothetical protein